MFVLYYCIIHIDVQVVANKDILTNNHLIVHKQKQRHKFSEYFYPLFMHRPFCAQNHQILF